VEGDWAEDWQTRKGILIRLEIPDFWRLICNQACEQYAKEHFKTS
jgi:hypothetical protein